MTAPGDPSQNSYVAGQVFLLSGRDGALLRAFSIPAQNSSFGASATGIADIDGDGVRDIAIGASGLGQVWFYSGRNGALIRNNGSVALGHGHEICDAGDLDGDGRGDVVTTTRGSNSGVSGYGLGVLSGRTGAALIDRVGTLPDVVTTQLLPLADLDGDGHVEILVGSTHFVGVLSLAPTPTLRAIPAPAVATNAFGRGALGFADLDGDGTPELLVGDIDAQVDGIQGAVFVFDARTGVNTQHLSIPFDQNPYFALGLAGMGDLDADGREDFAMVSSIANSNRTFELAFGRDLRHVPYWSPSPPYILVATSPRALTQAGDVDGDGFADLAVGSEYVNGRRGQVIVISGRILAQVQSVGTGCGGGPFLPQLGMTRPVLGQIAQVTGRDLPASAPGLLAFSLKPHTTMNLGVGGCDLAFDFGNWITLALLPPSPSLSMPLPIPAIPQLAGIDIALQTIHFDTGGALGVDLSNGIWARIGY